MKKRPVTLTPADDLKCKAVLHKSDHVEGPFHSLSKLLAEWAAFVLAVEQGYDFGIEDYTNDVSIRDLLEQVLRALSPEGKEKIRHLMDPLDERFNRATQRIERSLMPTLSQQYNGLWWYRIPKLLKSDLESDLTKEGIIGRT